MRYLLTTLITLLSLSLTAQQDTAKANGTLQQATVYFGYGAELTHQAILSVTKNTKYIIIDKLSTQLDVNSLQISCPDNVALLAQQYEIYYPTVKQLPKINNALQKILTDSIRLTSKAIGSLQNKATIEEATLFSTEKLITQTIATSANKTSLTADVLKLIEYNNQKIMTNKQNIYNLTTSISTLNELLQELQNRLAASYEPTITNTDENTTKAYGRITLQVQCNAAQQGTYNLSYYTQSAGWQPLYDLRVTTKTNLVKIIYKAAVTQTTGINWTKTKITLSTGTPNFTTTAPTFNPWYLQLYAPQLYKSITSKEVIVTGYATNKIQSMAINVNDEDEGNGIAIKDMVANNQTITPNTLQQYTSLTQGLLNTNFDIELPYDIASNGKQHSITIKEEEVKSNLKNYAAPKLDIDAYLVAEITNWENLDLLPGNANIIMDNTYIGKSFIDPNTTADTLNLSLGKDKRVAVKRTVIKDATNSKIKEDQTKQTFTYELTVKNNKTTASNILLKDQYPLSNNPEVKVELTNNSEAAVNPENGVLTWKLYLEPGEVIKKRFTYTVKYPKDKKITNLK